MPRPVVVFLCLDLFLLCAFQRSQQPQDPQLRVEVEAVNVLLTVTDREGRFITDLPKESFIVYEDGQVQTITNFSQESDLPLRIGLLVDTSASVRLKLDFEKDAARNFLYSVMRAQDRALLVEFDDGVFLRQDFTSQPSTIVEKVEDLQAGGGTALFDAIYTVARDKMAERGYQKTIVVLSDGRDLSSKRSLEDALEMSQKSEVAIFAIGTARFGASSRKEGEDVLKKLARLTGGRAFFPYSAELLGEAFDLINEELRGRYSLTYVPKNKKRDGSFRRIKVNIKGPKGMRIRHKEGYFAPEGS